MLTPFFFPRPDIFQKASAEFAPIWMIFLVVGVAVIHLVLYGIDALGNAVFRYGLLVRDSSREWFCARGLLRTVVLTRTWLLCNDLLAHVACNTIAGDATIAA